MLLFAQTYANFSPPRVAVGYGGVAPIAGEKCRGLSVILAGEALIGVIYNSLCGAIFYAKISRTEAIANVSFSSAACLQYERGTTDTDKRETTTVRFLSLP